jgi:tetratricopeptide (TPR) repeat protein
MKTTRLMLALILSGFAQPILSDSLSDVPADWQPTLMAVEEIDLSTLLPDEQKSILDTRSEIAQALQDTTATITQARLAKMYGRLGSLYEAQGLNTSADNCYSNALRLEPHNFRWAYYLAYNAHKNGNLPVALHRLQTALKIDAGYPPAISRLAQTYLDLDQLDKAQIEFSKLLDIKDFQAAGHNGLGQVLLLKHEYAQAVEHFTRALELEPEATKIHYPLAQALRALGQNELAQSHLRKYGDQQLIIPDPLVDELGALKNPAHRHFVAAMTWVQKKQYQKGQAEFEAGLQLDPDNIAARTSYARVLYLDGDNSRARSELELVLKQDPRKHLALFLLALLEEAASKPDAAAELYRRVLEIKPDHDGANFFLANYYMRMQEFQQAIEHYDRAIANDANNLPANLYRLVAMMGSGAPDAQLLDAVNAIAERAPGFYPPKRIRILLLALSQDSKVRNTELALTQATQMYHAHGNPLNTELMSIAKAATGEFDVAIKLMQQAIDAEQQQGYHLNTDRMQSQLADLRNKQLPALKWSDELRYLLPPMTNPLASFRDYPDANPI